MLFFEHFYTKRHTVRMYTEQQHMTKFVIWPMSTDREAIFSISRHTREPRESVCTQYLLYTRSHVVRAYDAISEEN